MKGRFLSLFLILSFIFCLFISCGDNGNAGEFTHCELTLVLDEGFSEEESRLTHTFLPFFNDIAVTLDGYTRVKLVRQAANISAIMTDNRSNNSMSDTTPCTACPG